MWGRRVLVGSDGADRLAGNANRDIVYGGRGIDVMSGGRGSDKLLAGHDNTKDIVRCGPGVDGAPLAPEDQVAADCEVVIIQS